MDKVALAWAAGLFEGEGCISYWKTQEREKKIYLQLALMTTDFDVLQRFRTVLNLGAISGPELKPNHKPAWRWRTASFESTQAVITMLWPWLGERRREKAKSALMAWRSCGRRYRAPKRILHPKKSR